MFIKTSIDRWVNLQKAYTIKVQDDQVILSFENEIVRIRKDDPEFEKARKQIERFLEESDFHGGGRNGK